MTTKNIYLLILFLVFPFLTYSQSNFDIKVYNVDSELIEYGDSYKEGFVVVEYTPGNDGIYLSLGADWADYSGPFGIIVENLYLPSISEVGSEKFSISTSFNLNSIAKATQGVEGTAGYNYPPQLVLYVHLLTSIGYYPFAPSTWFTTLEVLVYTYTAFAYNLIITTAVNITDTPGTAPPDQPVEDPKTTSITRRLRTVDLDNSSNPGVDGGYAGDLNACVPASHAQSMSWLEDEFDEITFPEGMKTTREKLVELSKKMNRAKENGIDAKNTLKGKLDFIESQKLPIDVKFQSIFEQSNVSSTSGKSIAKCFNRASNPWPDWEFLKQMLASGEDVEVEYLWLKESDTTWHGHAVTASGLEEFESGKKNLTITHDRRQRNADTDDIKGVTSETLDVGISQDQGGKNVVTLQRRGSTKKLWIKNVYAESPRPAEGEATATFLNEFFNMSGSSFNNKQNTILADNEFIEIGLDESVTNLADYSIQLYDGTDGTVYQTLTLDELTFGTKIGNYQTYIYTFTGNQLREAPAGIALSYTGTVVEGQFFSYGGSFTAAGGDATGMTSINMGDFVEGQSFVLQGAGTNYTDYDWGYSSTPSPGVFNDGQFLTASVPDTPTLQAPTYGSTEHETTLTLSWNDAQNVSSYTLEVATEQQFTNKIVDESDITATSKEVSNLNPGTLYYWRVKGVNGNGDSPYSSVWSFTTKSTGPVVSDIPDQTIAEGSSFTTIQLGDYVTDSDYTDSEITWSYSGNRELIISINGSRIATVSTPNADWNGSETITFTATNPISASASNQTTFTVTPVNDSPVVSDIPDQTITEGGSFATIQLDNYVTDSDNSDSEIIWSYSGNTELSVSIDGSRVATITVPNGSWIGNETITFTATDPGALSNGDQVVFSVIQISNAPIVSNIPSQTINEGESFSSINLDNYVVDSDNADSELTWTYSGNIELSVSIDASRVATITAPNQDWFGSEAITFTATDPTNQSGSDQSAFTINSVNDPPIIERLPSTIVISIDSSAVINLWDLVNDVEDSDSELIFEFIITADDIINLSFNAETGELTIATNSNSSGEEMLTIKIIDTGDAFVESSITVQIVEVTGVYEYLSTETPDDFVLMQNYPNPYNPTTNIRFGIPENSDIQLIIYNSLGELVQELVNQNMNSGNYEVAWDASNLPSGIYLIRINAKGLDSKKNFTQVKKAILLK